MMAMETQTARRRRTLQQVTSYVNPRLGLKDRMRAIRVVDQRQTESRIIEDALLYYIPMLEQRLQPLLEQRLQPMRDALAARSR